MTHTTLSLRWSTNVSARTKELGVEYSLPRLFPKLAESLYPVDHIISHVAFSRIRGFSLIESSDLAFVVDDNDVVSMSARS
jgi:hypothetical protein